MVSQLARLQRRVRRYPRLVQGIRSTRNIVHFGPWRAGLLACVRLTSSARQATDSGCSTLSGSVDLAATLHSLEDAGYFASLSVRPELVEASRPYWRDKKPGVYEDAHLACPALATIAQAPEIVRLTGAYFGCEPNMIECKLFVSKINNHADPLSASFHFDHAGLRSLNVMVYLTDVDSDSGPHVLVSGTHRRKKLRDFFREFQPIDEIERRHPDRIRVITGAAGTMLLENAELFHRREVASKPRVALITVYSTNRRRLLSKGRKEARV